MPRARSSVLGVLTAVAIIPSFTAAIARAGETLPGGYVYTDLHPEFPTLARTNMQGAFGGTSIGYSFLPGPIRDGRAIAFNTATQTPTILNPAPGLYDSYAFNIWGNSAVGVGRMEVGFQTYRDHAHVWDVSTGAATDLHPLMTGVDQSLGQDVWQNKVAIYAFGPATNNAEHAFIYDGSTFTDLHNVLPASDYDRTYRVRVFDQFATAWTEGAATGGNTHSILWDLSTPTPTARNLALETGLTSAQAEDIFDHRIVGSATAPMTGDAQRAYLWNVSPTDGSITAVDLHPAGWVYSAAMAVWGDLVVGVGQPAGASVAHAVAWNLLTGEVLDLHPPGLDGGMDERGIFGGGTPSAANGVDEFGNIFGTTGDSLQWRAAQWSIIPAPGAVSLFGAAALAALRRRRSGVV